MTKRERFLAACACEAVDRPPVWIMRQAGRYLPEYRALKERYSFLEMVRSPELAADVTLQPLARFPLDAAITFSDILVVPEAMGQPYEFADGGIRMAFTLEDEAGVERLEADGAAERLAYVADAQRVIRERVGSDTAVLGFCGSPWTLAVYMVEGGSPKGGLRLKEWAITKPDLFEELMQKVTRVTAQYLRDQIAAGVDAVQIFDSWAAWCPASNYDAWSLRWIREIIASLPPGYPVILYAKGMGHLAEELSSTGARVLGLDWTVRLGETAAALGTPRPALQGNLDPAVLSLEPRYAVDAANALRKQPSGQTLQIRLGPTRCGVAPPQ